MISRALLTAIFLSFTAAGQAAAEDFPALADRVSLAKQAELQEETRNYLRESMAPVADPFVAEAIRMCTNHPCASTDPFVVVADVTGEGVLSRVDYEPRTDSSECFANALARLRVPAPPTGAQGRLPIVLEMTISR